MIYRFDVEEADTALEHVEQGQEIKTNILGLNVDRSSKTLASLERMKDRENLGPQKEHKHALPWLFIA